MGKKGTGTRMIVKNMTYDIGEHSTFGMGQSFTVNLQFYWCIANKKIFLEVTKLLSNDDLYSCDAGKAYVYPCFSKLHMQPVT